MGQEALSVASEASFAEESDETQSSFTVQGVDRDALERREQILFSERVRSWAWIGTPLAMSAVAVEFILMHGTVTLVPWLIPVVAVSLLTGWSVRKNSLERQRRAANSEAFMFTITPTEFVCSGGEDKPSRIDTARIVEFVAGDRIVVVLDDGTRLRLRASLSARCAEDLSRALNERLTMLRARRAGYRDPTPRVRVASPDLIPEDELLDADAEIRDRR